MYILNICLIRGHPGTTCGDICLAVEENKKKQLADCRGSSLVIRVTSLTDNPAESIDILISDRVSGFPRINLATTVNTSTYDWLCRSHIISECGIIFWGGVLSHEWMKKSECGRHKLRKIGLGVL
jgi:hypothetical protein